MSKSKTNPYKVGDRIYLEHGSRGTVTAIDGPNVYISLDDMPINWMFSFDRIAGRLVKRKKKCVGCAEQRTAHDNLLEKVNKVCEINVELRRELGEYQAKVATLEKELDATNGHYSEAMAKLAKYESAEKFWVGTHRLIVSGTCKELHNNRIDVNDVWDEHWQVAVIDKKKASEE